jgi:hypothetical protein
MLITASPEREMYTLIHFYIYMFFLFFLRANPIFIFGGGDFGTH